MEEEDRKALIVHPDHRHTLPRGPVRHCFWEKLPTDVIACVAYHLPTHVDVCTFELVCRQARTAARDEKIWRRLLHSKYPNLLPRDCRPPPSYRALYKFNHELLYRVIMTRTQNFAGLRLGPVGTGVPFINVPVF